MATMKEVAQAAGVSITTVSHVLNQTRFVSDELSARVLEAIRELNYQPNVLARGLRIGQTNTIGLVVPDNSNPFFAEVARIIVNEGFENGYNVILCNSDNDLEKEAAYIDVLVSKKVDGIIFITTAEEQAHFQELVAREVPVVVADRELPEVSVDTVLVDNLAGGYSATRYLLELGHRRIGLITGLSSLTPSADRVAGYVNALAESGIDPDETLIVPGKFGYQDGEEAAVQLMSLPRPPTAIFACNDLMAIGALRALRNLQVPVPDLVSVVGFDDIELASAVYPALTTVAQPTSEIATMSLKLLLNRIQRNDHTVGGRKEVLQPELIVRDSCGLCRDKVKELPS